MIIYTIRERDDWFICSRKPIICPRCQKKEVRPSIFGMPTPEVWESGKYHIAGCQPDFPKHRTWGCRQCNAAFFKDTPRNRDALGGIVPWQWRKDDDKKPPKYYKVEQSEEIPF